MIPQETLLRIVRAEDERKWDDADLGALLSDRNASVRRRAALAAGRIGDEGAVAPLASLLQKDLDEDVRAMAAFALGETESGSAADALLAALRTSKSVEVRARALEALGKIAAALPKTEEARQKAIGESILGALQIEHQRLPRPERAIVIEGLTAALRARHPETSKTVASFLSSPDARVRADAANVLARLRAKDANEQLRPLLTGDSEAIVRANAARALGAAEDQGALDLLVARATGDLDERVRVSSIRALAALRDARAAEPLLKRADTLFETYRAAKANGAARPWEVNELLEIAAALGRVLANAGNERAVAWLRAFRQAQEWGAPEVEVALARVAPAQYVREHPFDNLSGRAAASGETKLGWQSIASIAQGLGEVAAVTSAMGGNSAVSLQADAQLNVRALLNDQSTPAVALPDVLRALAAFKPPDLAEILRAKLAASDDVIVRATIAELLGELAPDAATTRALAEALPRSLNDEMNDAVLAILDALAKQKSIEAFDAIKSVLDVPDHLVRRRAAALLKENGVGEVQKRIETVATRNRLPDYRRALARTGKPVRALVTTDKGSFTINLLPDDAPLTVDNFVELARRGFFKEITFHRVVPNFVIQGGDPRGDGNGGPGSQIRCEINQVPYARGAVGMALSGKDTGGSQWFVTHSPQPHLDGGYTVFGRVVEGMEVVDRIVRGDRILSITVTEGARPASNGSGARGRARRL